MFCNPGEYEDSIFITLKCRFPTLVLIYGDPNMDHYLISSNHCRLLRASNYSQETVYIHKMKKRSY